MVLIAESQMNFQIVKSYNLESPEILIVTADDFEKQSFDNTVEKTLSANTSTKLFRKARDGYLKL